MGNFRFGPIFSAFFVVSLWIDPTNCKAGLLTSQAALFVFGDSLFDVGNNNYINTIRSAQANFWPYGMTTFKSPTGRFSDGRVIPDFIGTKMYFSMSIPPYLQPGNNVNQFTYGVNFASAGAGALATTFQGLVIDLKTQLRNFKNVEKILTENLGDAEAKKLLSRAVYLFHIGANDYFYPFSLNSSSFQSHTKKAEFVDIVVGNITAVIKEVYSAGGRKFGFMNMGRFDCVPNALVMDPTRIGACFKPITEFINLHNQAFPRALKNLEIELSGFKYALHDFHSLMSRVMNNPSKYGFKEVKKACCGSGPFRGINTCGYRLGMSEDYELCENVRDYMFFDSSHGTEKAYGQIAKLMWSGQPNVTGPYNIKMLFEFKDV
ncbi:PREDICTED: GDSL esterase/lipase 3-like [Tarenaya hassleriana]|uniref:GDSL esterase/lipase 3-like n=1 Tax=Tarenaya hassleriana TaxID=28532 RepID=UPI00053C5640|nr:PREDICTED: GDSL esterase/lipase 3-like [Tarenaya hassleriana]